LVHPFEQAFEDDPLFVLSYLPNYAGFARFEMLFSASAFLLFFLKDQVFCTFKIIFNFDFMY